MITFAISEHGLYAAEKIYTGERGTTHVSRPGDSWFVGDGWRVIKIRDLTVAEIAAIEANRSE